KIALTISAACASTGWTVNGAVSKGYSLAHWPIEAQRELWEGDADPFTFACFAPTGTAIPVEGGYRLSGQWSFASGCDLAQWGKLGAMITPPGKEPPYEGAFFLLPEGDYEIVDNWFVCGLAGTGSKDVIVKGAFVPEHRVLRFADTRAGTSPGARHHDNPIYRLPLLMVGASMLASTAIGAAKGAPDAFVETTTGRKTRGALAGGNLRMAEFATVQLRVAEAAASVEAAELILLTDMRMALQKLRVGGEITVADRIRTRRNQAYVTKLALRAAEALNAATGGYGLHLSNPVQRAWRDANAVARHVNLNWDAVGTMYGQHFVRPRTEGPVLTIGAPRRALEGRYTDGRNSRVGVHPLADLVSAQRALDRRLQAGARRPERRSGGEGPGQLAIRTLGRARQ